MSKKKAAADKSEPKASRPAKQAVAKKVPPGSIRTRNPAGRRPRAADLHVYRHKIDGNPTNAPLIVDIPIAEGRGPNPHRPAAISFTAEMAEEHWPDQFAFRVISLEGSRVRVMVSRIDKGSSEQGWGVKLVIHVLVVDQPSA